MIVYKQTYHEGWNDIAAACNAAVALLRGINQVVKELDVPVIWKLTQHDQNVLKRHQIKTAKQVHIVEFAPQNDLLGSGCVRVFVTQGGSNSYLEVRHLCFIAKMHVKMHTMHVQGRTSTRDITPATGCMLMLSADADQLSAHDLWRC